MTPQQAVITLSRLKQLNQPLVALTPEDYCGCGLPIVKKLIDQKTKQPIFLYVDRLKLIELIKKTHELHDKGDANALHRIIGAK